MSKTVLVTGANGFIGSAVVKELLAAGHRVIGLARKEASAKALVEAGVRVHTGSVQDVDTLRRAAAEADAAIHLAFFHQPGHMRLSTFLGIMFGGGPRRIADRFLKAAVETETRAIEAIGKALTGPDRTLIAVLPTPALPPGRLATEKDAPDPKAAGSGRAPSETAALDLVAHGIRSMIVRLPPVVHDRSKQGFATMMAASAKKKGLVAYQGSGGNRWPAVHRLDAARLFRLALEQGTAGGRYHAVGEEGVPMRDIAAALGKQLNLPAVSRPARDVVKMYGFVGPFVGVDNPVSSRLTQEQLGWQPNGPSLIADLS